MSIAISHPRPGLSLLTGDLTFDTVSKVYDALGLKWHNGGHWTIDLSGVKHCDSAGLAVLIHWLEQANQQQVTLQFTQLPAQLKTLAKVSEVNMLFESKING